MAERTFPEPPPDPSDEELARDWTLSVADKVEVQRSRGEAHRHRFAIQLCALRTLGRFIEELSEFPVKITNHIGKQLGIAPALLIEAPERPATFTEQAQRIREYLGYQSFDEAAEERLKQWLMERAGEGIVPTLLSDLALNALRAWKVEIPGRWTFDRLVGSCSARGEQETWRKIHERLPPEFCAAVDRLLEVTEGERTSRLFGFKQYPPEPTAAAINLYLGRFNELRELGAGKVDFSDLGSEVLKYVAALGRKYDVTELRRFAPVKRYALVAAFLADAQKTTLDHLVEMHREFMTGIGRRARNAVDKRHKEVRSQGKKSYRIVVQIMEMLLDSSRPQEERAVAVLEQFGEEKLREVKAAMRALEELGERGYVDELKGRHSNMKRYLTGFLKLPFRAQPGTEKLLAAVEIARKLDAGELTAVPGDAPTHFVPGGWHAALADGKGRYDRRVWELALAFAVKDALRAGDLYLAESRNYVSFWSLLHGEDQWAKKKDGAYDALNLPTEADLALAGLRKEFDEAAGLFSAGLETNIFAGIHNGALELSKREAVDVPAGVGELRRVLEAHMDLVRIEDLLVKVDGLTGFTRELRPPPGYKAQGVDNLYVALLAALVAQGTNLGIVTMAQSIKGISVDVLHRIGHWYLREDALKAANRILVDYHHRLPLASVWGDGIASSSDGQRFAVQEGSLLASYYPRYFGHYDKAVSVYTHTSDQHSVFSSQVISCSVREALYVLDGLLENQTVLRIREHYTDTHGFTEQLFALCWLLGFSFMPRLKDLKDQQLYKMDRSSYGELDDLFRGPVDTALIREQWDQLVRIASSLRERTSPAHVIMDRLAANGPSDRLAKALAALGRVIKTTYILRYLSDAKIRDRVQLQLNRGESRHQLARRLFFANQGAFRSGDYAEIMNKVSALSVLSNAVLVHNTVRMDEIVQHLQKRRPVLSEHMARISPLAFQHVIPSGTYDFHRASAGVSLPN